MKNKVRKGYYADRFKWAIADFHYNKPVLSIPIYVAAAVSLVMGGVKTADNNFEFKTEYTHDVSETAHAKQTANIFQNELVSLKDAAENLEATKLAVTRNSFDLDDKSALKKATKSFDGMQKSFDKSLENYIVQMYGNTSLSEADFKTLQTDIVSAGWSTDGFSVGNRVMDVDADSLKECQRDKGIEGKTITKDLTDSVEGCMLRKSSEDAARVHHKINGGFFGGIGGALILLLGVFAGAGSEDLARYGSKPERKDYRKELQN